MKLKDLVVTVSAALFLPLSHGATLAEQLTEFCPECAARVETQTGAYILEKGEEALISRAWLADHASESIDVQYFIWSTDNIGILAGEALLRAAERGVVVRVLVDDLLVDAQSETLLTLSAHPNVDIKIYNPKHSVGVSFFQRVKNLLTQFHQSNQRMHDKAVIYDGLLGITGGRNMADEYFDYNHQYNFRDRDILLVGHEVSAMSENFNQFWDSPLSVAVSDIFIQEMSQIDEMDIRSHTEALHQYAQDAENFAPEVRQMLQNLPERFADVVARMRWGKVRYISDSPGKNDQQTFLGGGGDTTQALVEQLQQAKESVFIQSPYLIIPEGGMALLQQLIERGVTVKISTNSLASTDNLMAFSGYAKQRQRLLETGVEVYEYKPYPAIKAELNQRYPSIADNNPIFALHAKSMVVDGEHLFIGTFNLDPRSANLNTEVGVLMSDKHLGQQLQQSIDSDIAPENSWRVTAEQNPDSNADFYKRLKLAFYKLLPLDPVL